MHSRIFQLSTRPISESNYITESLFYNGFVGNIADYVSNDVDRDKDIEWFISTIEIYGAEYNKADESILFTRGFKEKYFEHRFNRLKKIISTMTLEDFTRSGVWVYEIEKLVDDKFGFYIYEGHLQTLDEFVRCLETEVAFYIGGIIDYHS